MRNPFTRKAVTDPADELTDPGENAHDAPIGSDASPEALRDTIFDGLAKRMGHDSAQLMREDFDHHISEDGIDAAWTCLTGKLIDTVDRFNDILSGNPPGTSHAMATSTGDALADQDNDGPVSPFTVFRKDG